MSERINPYRRREQLAAQEAWARCIHVFGYAPPDYDARYEENIESFARVVCRRNDWDRAEFRPSNEWAAIWLKHDPSMTPEKRLAAFY